jgi:hypothetical protein
MLPGIFIFCLFFPPSTPINNCATGGGGRKFRVVKVMKENKRSRVKFGLFGQDQKDRAKRNQARRQLLEPGFQFFCEGESSRVKSYIVTGRVL